MCSFSHLILCLKDTFCRASFWFRSQLELHSIWLLIFLSSPRLLKRIWRSTPARSVWWGCVVLCIAILKNFLTLTIASLLDIAPFFYLAFYIFSTSHLFLMSLRSLPNLHLVVIPISRAIRNVPVVIHVNVESHLIALPHFLRSMSFISRPLISLSVHYRARAMILFLRFKIGYPCCPCPTSVNRGTHWLLIPHFWLIPLNLILKAQFKRSTWLFIKCKTVRKSTVE